MTINPITVASAISTTSNTAATSSGNDPADQRDMFMRLLVAQLKNQDPLSPQDGTAFVAQLAQFNSLDQLVGIRQAIDQLTTLIGQNNPLPTTRRTNQEHRGEIQ